MSLRIQIDDITAVLLSDGWHQVIGGSFDIDAYEFMADDELAHNGGSGFVFVDWTEATITGPMSSVIAVCRKPAT